MMVNFGAKRASGWIVIESPDFVFGAMGRRIGKLPPLRVKYRNHFWNSESDEAKRMYAEYARKVKQFLDDKDITAESVQKNVEEFLVNHPDRKRVDGKGFYILDEKGTKIEPAAIPVTCMTIMVSEETGESNVCGKPVLDGEKYCAECIDEMTAVS